MEFVILYLLVNIAAGIAACFFGKRLFYVLLGVLVFLGVFNVALGSTDASPTSLVIGAALGVVADIKEVLAALNREPLRQEYGDWFARIEEWKKKYPPFRYKSRNDRLQPQFVIETLSKLTQGKAVIVPGVGQHQMWAAQYYDYSFPRQLLTSGGLGAMGFGLPAAMGRPLQRLLRQGRGVLRRL